MDIVNYIGNCLCCQFASHISNKHEQILNNCGHPIVNVSIQAVKNQTLLIGAHIWFLVYTLHTFLVKLCLASRNLYLFREVYLFFLTRYSLWCKDIRIPSWRICFFYSFNWRATNDVAVAVLCFQECKAALRIAVRNRETQLVKNHWPFCLNVWMSIRNKRNN